ncbi:MAG TPA: histidine phosphatase family protein [Candidatus Saccharimonadales bacterium]|nr:histidine phosphatase family protein [Candidatus Saccharimonadales bacterium]
MAVDIFIARHGQDEDNAAGILNGQRDKPLTELGRQQARALAESIVDAGLQFEAIYTSPLKRAAETAEIVGEIIGLKTKPIIIAELIERDFGVMSGKPISSIEEICGDNIIKSDMVTYFLDPEGAETFPELMERGLVAIRKIRGRQASGKALLVCHGDLGKMVYAAEAGKEWKDVLTDFHFGNAELIEITPNQDAHLVKLPQHNA